MEQQRKAVVVTGFGPFGEHTVNASWIAVQELEKLGLGDSVDLHVYEIPVEYKTVQRLIPALWEKHSPQLVVHVGVSGMATTVTLEKCGHNKGYKGLDNCRFCPGSQCCVEDGPESIDSIIDMDAVCKRVTTLGLDVSVTISQDAGSLGSQRSEVKVVAGLAPSGGAEDISATLPTTPLCTRATVDQPSSMCPRWGSLTAPTSWAGR
ncbi:pyroglutamyl-peptidase 1 isoform X2 [Aotus nancymaae]|uniref:pyroglutamyl-peptidase 1 isoform X2 n=1 Tax=Aotus nancymaae TaxID=37293 RepID=UPI0030FE3EAA